MNEEKRHTSLKSFLTSEYRNLLSYVKRYFNEKYYDVYAEDIIQDVAVNLFSKLDFDEQLDNIAGYVYRSLKNRIVDFQRKKKKEIPFRKFADSDENDSFSESIKNTEDVFVKAINDDKFYASLNSALEKLSPNQHMVFVATEIEGYTYEELSDKLEIPIGTLLSWKHRGVKKLKELIKLEDLYSDYVK